MCSAVLASASGPASAQALVSAAQPVDGPSAAIRELGGVAMSADGTGGLVYRKDDDGRPHIFVARFVGGAWRAPQRVDVGADQGFESSWPSIAAGDGGRLLVVWVQEFGASDRLYSATLQPGASRFEPPAPVDLGIGDSALGTWPSLSMSPGGQAYLVYRVVTDAQPASVPPDNVLGEYRIARYTGQYWNPFGTPINRNPAAGQPTPSALNRPRIATDQLGDAVVAWQELDDAFVPRIYARRVFPTSTGIALPVSPPTLDGRDLNAGADQFDLSVARFGAAAIAWRQAPPQGAGAWFTRPRAYVATSPNVYSDQARAFGTPRAIDGAGDDGPVAGLGPIAVSAGDPDLLATFASGGALAVDADETTVAAPARLDDGAGVAPIDPVGVLGDGGAAAFAWKRNNPPRGGLVLRERRTDGVVADRILSAPRGGQVDDVRISGSGAGDALVAATQGEGDGRQLVAAWIDAPPQAFNVQAPLDWVRTANVELTWDPAVHAIGGVTYDVVVDDDTVASGVRGTTALVRTSDLDSGARTITIVATDDAGQETTSVPAQLKLDRLAPTATVRVRGRSAVVAVRDGARGTGSGVRAARTRITFGDGVRVANRSRVTHRFRRPGRYRVVVRAADRAGNTALVRRTVSVR